MSATEIDLPIIINGRTRYPGVVPEPDVWTIRYEHGIAVRIPKFTRTDLEALHGEADEIDAELARMPVRDIITFLGQVGEQWDARKLSARMFVRKHAHRVTQFSDLMMEGDYATFGHFLMQRFHLYDQIESEFGSDRIFDEWVPVQMGYRRAFPRGLALHYLVGNMPLAAMYSLVRGMVSKNRTIAKLPSRDPITALGLAMAVLEVDPEHPVSRSLSLAYWPHDDPLGAECIASVDAACVWGGEAAVKAVKAKIQGGVPLSEYGPKWSVSAIDLSQCNAADAAMRVVDDAAYYDQEACFNTQRAFVRGDVDDFVEKIADAFETFCGNLPFVSSNRDILAHRSLVLREATYRGWRVETGRDWAVVVLPESEIGFRHPLARTLYIHPVKDLGAVARHFNRRTQTLSVYPWSIIADYRDAWAAAGADRMVELGWSRIPRAGFTHDGMLGMHGLVRLVSIDRPWTDPGKYYSQRPNLSQYWFVDKYPQVRAMMDRDDI